MSKKIESEIGSYDITFDEEQTKAAIERIAQMYENPYRVLYEYIQNSVDNAHSIRLANGGAFPYPIEVRIHLTHDGRTVSISDNCEGMSKEKLEELITKIFKSSKKSVPWAAGQFGYGVQSFRAFFEELTFISRTSHHESLRLVFSKDRISGNKMFLAPGGVKTPSGTIVILKDLDKQRKRYKKIDPFLLKNEIELHFENILREENLSIHVDFEKLRRGTGIIKKFTLRCEPFDYSKYPGTEIKETIDYNGRNIATLWLKVLEGALSEKRLPKFTTLNTRVNEMCTTQSFIKEPSAPAERIWGHPLLVGYVDVSKDVELHIDRSDFGPSIERDIIYKKLINLENETLRKLLKTNVEKKSLRSFDTLSELFQDTFSEIAKLDNIRLIKELRAAAKGAIETDAGGRAIGNIGTIGREHAGGTPPEEPSGVSNGPVGPLSGDGSGGVNKGAGSEGAKEVKRSGIPIQIKALGEDGPMADRIDGVIYVNESHKNFQERAIFDDYGRLDLSNGRLIHYIAQLVTTYYIQDRYERYSIPKEVSDALFFNFTDVVCKAESLFFNNKNIVSKMVEKVG